MLSKTLTGISGFDPEDLADPGHMAPVIFTNPDQVPSPLPPGATVSPAVLPPTWIEGALAPDRMEEYYKVGLALQDHGFLQGFDFAGALGAIGAGAAMGDRKSVV